MLKCGTPVEIERHNRIMVAIWAYAYEFENDSMVSDEIFDATCRAIDTSVSTGHKILDEWFKNEFMPDTGMWIHKHPELDKVKNYYLRIKRDRKLYIKD